MLSIGALVLGVDLSTANNTIAIVLAGPIAKEISDEFGIDPRRSASLLDIFASVGQGLIPWGAQMLYAAAAAEISAYSLIPYTFYPILMLVCALGFIFFVPEKKADK
jgi:Na+/H+ antiporter NhaC